MAAQHALAVPSDRLQTCAAVNASNGGFSPSAAALRGSIPAIEIYKIRCREAEGARLLWGWFRPIS
jgi:hypothetical protein